jgi:hypothetical protein
MKEIVKKHIRIIHCCLSNNDKSLLHKIAVQVMPLGIFATVAKPDNLLGKYFQFFPANIIKSLQAAIGQRWSEIHLGKLMKIIMCTFYH